MTTPWQQFQHPLAGSQPWLRRLHDEAGPDTDYGFAIYYLPSVVEEDGLEAVQERHDLLIEQAMLLMGSACIREAPCLRLQPMSWPLSLNSEASTVSAVTSRIGDISLQSQSEHKHFTDELEDRHQIRTPGLGSNTWNINTTPLVGIDADDVLVSTFQDLREHFKTFRALPRSAFRWGGSDYMKPETFTGLIDGLLDNVFIVVNENSAYTWWDVCRPHDLAWVWAVDADFKEEQGTSGPVNGLYEEYRGYLRVRLQQLTNWFSEACYFRPELTLRDLWDAARQSRNYSFVSLDPELYHAKEALSNWGSALRPTHLRKVQFDAGNGVKVSRWELMPDETTADDDDWEVIYMGSKDKS